MAENSKIEWTDHTASPWHGCSKVSDGCDHCYAATMSARNPGVLGVWGDDGVRVKSKSFINNLKRWNAEAAKTGKPVTVFPSLCDPFEDRPELWEWRNEMFKVVDSLPHVRLLLLTKRPENIQRMWPAFFPGGYIAEAGEMNQEGPRHNIWLGTSCENQEQADKRIPELLKCRDLSPVLFLSCEPLLGPVDLTMIATNPPYEGVDALGGQLFDCVAQETRDYPKVDWVIVGGESGPCARPMHPDWARSLRDQCRSANVPFLFKQWGEWVPELHPSLESMATYTRDDQFVNVLRDDSGKPIDYEGAYMFRVGKKQAGRLLDGVLHDGFPGVVP